MSTNRIRGFCQVGKGVGAHGDVRVRCGNDSVRKGYREIGWGRRMNSARFWRENLLGAVRGRDPDENSSQIPPHINHHYCYGCGDLLDGIFCQRCTCESCGNGAHIGYNCASKVPIISNPEPCPNQNVDEGADETFQCQTLNQNFYEPNHCYNSNSFGFDQSQPQQFPVIHQPPQQTSVEILHDLENVIKSVQTFLRKFNRYSFFETLKVLLLAWDRVFEIKDAFRNKQYKPKDIQELIRKLFNDVQNIHEELAEYINTLSWNRPAFYNYDDDDDNKDYTIAITPILSTEEPIDSLIMKDEHLDTILAMESDEVIKSSVKDLAPFPNQFENFSDSNDDSTSIDDDYFSVDDIDYIEASPPDSELVSLEEVKDDILHEKLLKIHLLIAKIESLNDNPTPDRVLKSPSLFPIPVEDSDSFFKKSDASLSYSDNSLPEFETFSYHTEETSSGNTTTYADYSLPEYDLFLFELKPDQD
uniref:CCHC-type domain-containing protein n=1 Tax=Tanacetum cinerariifolium TaxID=118510 RepID=A0A6L2KXQ3_TANCI|nr:hypothetical protein [Tanacetum cinerariifolium]